MIFQIGGLFPRKSMPKDLTFKCSNTQGMSRTRSGIPKGTEVAISRISGKILTSAVSTSTSRQVQLRDDAIQVFSDVG